jgi:hypothetical protein
MSFAVVDRPQRHLSHKYRVSRAEGKAGGKGSNRDEFYVNLGCLRECAQPAGS